MDIYSAWPFFVSLALLFAMAATPVLAAADQPPSDRPNRLATLDGLRGFLALAVVFHHGAIYHLYLLEGSWRLPPSPFYAMLGQAGVAVFFMVTGYLFWSRLIGEAGRPAWIRLFIGRVFRIGPLYLAAIAAMFAIVAVESSMSLNVTPRQLLASVAPWLALGFLGGGDVNGYPSTWILLAGVNWSLRFEWLFYLSLPLLSLAARSRRAPLPLTLAGLVICLLGLALRRSAGPVGLSENLTCATLFLAGMAAAALRRGGWRRGGWRRSLPDWLSSALLVTLVTVTFLAYDAVDGPGPVLLLGGAFYLVASGCSVFGLLLTRPARRLGDISYGIYLLQGLALHLVLRPAPLRAMALSSPTLHWLLVLVSAVLLVLIATVAHVVVERPGIAAGRLLANRLDRRAAVSP